MPRPAHNPANDIEANVVLAAPTASGISAGTAPAAGAAGMPVLANNVIPFDLSKSVTSIVNWGDTTNVKLLTQLMTSALGHNTVPMSRNCAAGLDQGRRRDAILSAAARSTASTPTRTASR